MYICVYIYIYIHTFIHIYIYIYRTEVETRDTGLDPDMRIPAWVSPEASAFCHASLKKALLQKTLETDIHTGMVVGCCCVYVSKWLLMCR